MPTFYPRAMPRHLPLTPPEFVPSYNSCANQYQQTMYNGQSGIRRQEEGSYGYERYDHAQLPSVQSALMYGHPHNGTYANNSVATYYEPMTAPILPPMRVHEQHTMNDLDMHRHSQANQAKEEKPTGGVSAKLDYDMDTMSDFVSDIAQGIIQQGRPQPQSFRKWVHGVLCATRLPSATIILGLHYLSRRMTQLSRAGQTRAQDNNCHRFLTLGLLLGSKFLDDNTFINRSWSEVSGIGVADLNALETEWLAAFDFRLHCDPAEANGFNSWMDHWKEFEANALARANRQNKLAPINTQVQQFSGVKSYSAAPYHAGYGKQLPTPDFTMKHSSSQYSTPAYSHYDPWASRSAHDHSPASTAPLTGPTTPEYYGSSTAWATPEGYSRRTMFGFPPASQNPPAPQHHNAYSATCYTPQYSQGMWNAHPMHCSCFHCARQHSYMMSSNFAPQPVAG